RLEALGPVITTSPGSAAPLDLADTPTIPRADEPLLIELETQGVLLRCRLEGRQAWCERRLLARIHRYTLDRLRREIEPVTAGEFWRFLACWQHADERFRLEGPRGVAEVVRKLAGFEIPAAEWESSILPARVRGFRPEWLDQLTLTGDVAWGRLWGGGNSAVRSMPITLLPREDLEDWLTLAVRARSERTNGNGESLSTYARTILEAMEARGACFAQELARASRLLPAHFEMGLTQLIGHGLVTCDSFGGLRRLITSPSHRRGVMKRVPLTPAGRWSRFRTEPLAPFGGGSEVEFAARQLLRRYGIVFRRVIERERIPVPWRDLVRTYRHWELRGEVRGGRFVQRFAGEQYAQPEAVELIRRLRRKGLAIEFGAPIQERRGPETRSDSTELLGLSVSAGDPLNLDGILTPEPRIPAQARRKVLVG
ncbi:MAG TPA: hypothetical protein VEY91_10495, partial [Candidatus Limnocylindria bacterium]|nr:hypothetical protein [Candidatus Limnocylindria bacterium]